MQLLLVKLFQEKIKQLLLYKFYGDWREGVGIEPTEVFVIKTSNQG